MRHDTFNQHDELILTFDCMHLLRRREGGMGLRGLTLGGLLLLLAACGGRGDLPPPVIEDPRLSRNGELSGSRG